MNDASNLTPMMQQYRELKARDPDALLLFRMGDFYEMFGDDAERASPLLGITLTTRDKEKGAQAVPMAGFPHFALEGYLGKLVAAGVRVAVCEQVEDPKLAKGLVRREVVRVVTPGTLTDDALLDPRAANYLAAVVETKGKLGLSWAELSTGRFQVSATLRQDLFDEIARVQPAEVLVSELALDAAWVHALRQRGVAVTSRPSWDFQAEQARQALFQHFRVSTLAGFGLDDQAIEITAAGALIAYLRETQKTHLTHFTRIAPYRRSETMAMDEMTRRGLEISRTLREGRREGSLLQIVDQTRTPMGARLLAEWLTAPLTCLDAIARRHEVVAELVREPDLRQDLRALLDQANDVERLAARAATGRAMPRDLVGLGRTLGLLPKLKARITARDARRLRELETAIELCPEIHTAIRDALVDDPPLALKDGGLIRQGYHPILDELRETAQGGKTWIARFQAEQIRRTGINSLKVGYNKIFGYYIEITHTHGSKVPPDYLRKQTVKNAERYITPELKEYEDKVLRAEERSRDLEYELFLTLRDRVASEAPRLVQLGGLLAELDVFCGLAELAARRGYIRPEMVAAPVLDVDGGKHPVLDATMRHGDFVPNDTRLGVSTSHGTVAESQGMVLLITGPNMAGKSTYIRQVALLAILAQAGGFVPAVRARIGVVDRLFARVGATDELARGLSTFMVEMTETANILHNATAHSLVILDEIGRGTSTFDGISLAWAIVEHLHDTIGCRTLFATHYHELVALESSKPRLRNANVEVRENAGEIVFLHRIVPGGADQSYGIHVARLAGVPEPVIDRARDILVFLEKQHAQDGAATVSGAIVPSSSPGQGAMPKRVKTARALQSSLFAALPEPLVDELRTLNPEQLTPEQLLDLVQKLKGLAQGD